MFQSPDLLIVFCDCTENLKHIFPEMPLHSRPRSHFYIHVSGSDLYSPPIGLIWNLYYPVLYERTLSSTVAAERIAGNCRQGGLAAVPCPLLSSCGWAQSSHKWPTYKFSNFGKLWIPKWKQLIIIVNFLYGLRMNETPNKTILYWILTGLHFQCSKDTTSPQNRANTQGSWKERLYSVAIVSDTWIQNAATKEDLLRKKGDVI
jgi:hypothetical protein